VYTEKAEQIKQHWADKAKIDAIERELTLKERRERIEALKRAEEAEEEENQIINSPTKSKYNKSALFECRRTVFNLSPPPTHGDWHGHWGNCLLCYICEKPAVTDTTRCSKCNIIAHVLCMQYKIMNSDHPEHRDMCPHCEEALRMEEEFYQREVDRLKYERLLELSATMVTRRAHVYLAMKRYERTRQSIRHIQAVCRGIITRLRYKIQRRAVLRVVLLNILRLPALPEPIMKTGLLVMTVMDTFKGIQLFRFDVPLETVLEESLLVPGLASYMTLVFTLCLKEEVYTYAMLAQAQICIRDMINPAQKKEVGLNLMEKIQVTLLDGIYYGINNY